MTDPYIAKLLEMQNRILDRQAKALEDIAEAPIEELMLVRGITEELAVSIHEQLNA